MDSALSLAQDLDGTQSRGVEMQSGEFRGMGSTMDDDSSKEVTDSDEELRSVLMQNSESDANDDQDMQVDRVADLKATKHRHGDGGGGGDLDQQSSPQTSDIIRHEQDGGRAAAGAVVGGDQELKDGGEAHQREVAERGGVSGKVTAGREADPRHNQLFRRTHHRPLVADWEVTFFNSSQCPISGFLLFGVNNKSFRLSEFMNEPGKNRQFECIEECGIRSFAPHCMTWCISNILPWKFSTSPCGESHPSSFCFSVLNLMNSENPGAGDLLPASSEKITAGVVVYKPFLIEYTRSDGKPFRTLMCRLRGKTANGYTGLVRVVLQGIYCVRALP